jgi:hypothetical protein
LVSLKGPNDKRFGHACQRHARSVAPAPAAKLGITPAKTATIYHFVSIIHPPQRNLDRSVFAYYNNLTNQMANVLPREKQVLVLRCLTEGMSVRGTERLCDVSRETVLSLLVRVGEGCARLLDGLVRGLSCDRVECAEIWAFCPEEAAPRDRVRQGGEVGDTGRS